MNRTLALICWLVLVHSAFAQDDEPIPYPDEEEEESKDRTRRKLPPTSDPEYTIPEETEVEKKDRERSMANLDDPNWGFGGELTGGVLMIDSARGTFAEARGAFGLRFVWEYGRTFFPEGLREALFADLNWSWAFMHEGTQLVFTDTHYHYFTIAPAYAYPLGGPDSPWAIYAQLGGGIAVQSSTLNVGTAPTNIAAIKPLFQYGIGFRGRPLITPDGLIRISFRAELYRYRRHYMDDTYLGLSVGGVF
jgi:hypothetical protein